MSEGDSQLDRWAGGFGRAYTDRNVVDWRVRVPAFRTMLGGLPLASVLEVGCNRGHNLVAIADATGAAVTGLEPNEYALELARQAAPSANVVAGVASDLPFPDGTFDCVLTAGVLIHVPPDELDRVLIEIVRVARRYVLAVEYHAERDETIVYRGNHDMLWKRDFRSHYMRVAPDLTVLRDGFWGAQDGFDDARWWLFERPQP